MGSAMTITAISTGNSQFRTSVDILSYPTPEFRIKRREDIASESIACSRGSFADFGISSLNRFPLNPPFSTANSRSLVDEP
jgi:hypothetical protein